jgi:hypothetical protein
LKKTVFKVSGFKGVGMSYQALAIINEIETEWRKN